MKGMIFLEIYIVKSGDTLYDIASRFDISLDDLIFANQLQNPSVLSVGQALIIPRNQISYSVQDGDTLYSIAEKFGVTLINLIDANPQIPNPNFITVGQTIIIPPVNKNLGNIIVNGYLTDALDTTLNATLPFLTYMSPFSYRSDINGDLIKTFNLNTNLSQNFGVGNFLTVTNLKEQGGFSSDIAHKIFTDETVQNTFLGNAETLLARGGYVGINVDFEYIYPSDRENYNNFLKRLTDRMHSLGYIVSTALAPKISDNQQGLLYTAHDYAFHGKTVDYVILMTYEWGYTYGPAMAVAPLNMVERVLNYAVQEIPSEKILMGVPNYGYDWTLPFVEGTAARAVSNIRAVTLAGEVNASINFDETAKAPYFNYFDSNQRKHEVWFEDARSLQAKYELVNKYNLGGISFWNLNTLFRTNFLVLESMYTIMKNA